jgi:GH35 family endo-1,4-beta-xylanase
VHVVDADGKPVSGADVSIEMKRHAFRFGAAFDAGFLFPKEVPAGVKLTLEEYEKRYRELITSGMFNYVVLENTLKYGPWTAGEKDAGSRALTFKMIDWLRERGFEVKGHTMHWGFRELKDWGMKKDEAWLRSPEARQSVLDHIRDIGSANRGKLSTWDVVNEHFIYHDSTDYHGRDFAVDWFKAAHEATGGARLFWNEPACLTMRPAGISSLPLLRTGSAICKRTARQFMALVTRATSTSPASRRPSRP